LECVLYLIQTAAAGGYEPITMLTALTHVAEKHRVDDCVSEAHVTL